jgi:hypothetical protein
MDTSKLILNSLRNRSKAGDEMSPIARKLRDVLYLLTVERKMKDLLDNEKFKIVMLILETDYAAYQSTYEYTHRGAAKTDNWPLTCICDSNLRSIVDKYKPVTMTNPITEITIYRDFTKINFSYARLFNNDKKIYEKSGIKVLQKCNFWCGDYDDDSDEETFPYGTNGKLITIELPNRELCEFIIAYCCEKDLPIVYYTGDMLSPDPLASFALAGE